MTPDEDSQELASEVLRKAWEPLGFEKIDIADAEAGSTGVGGDFGIYS